MRGLKLVSYGPKRERCPKKVNILGVRKDRFFEASLFRNFFVRFVHVIRPLPPSQVLKMTFLKIQYFDDFGETFGWIEFRSKHPDLESSTEFQLNWLTL